MQKLFKKMLRVLDGAPPPDRQRQRGQSLLELAFITPLLAIMVIGIIEIGWYANHFLIILEVTRVGARAGTALTGDLSPQNWNNQASIHPFIQESVLGEPTATSDSINYRDCELAAGRPAFFNFIVCTMLQSLEPLTLRGRASTGTDTVNKTVRDRAGNIINVIPFPDDIIVSVFSLQAVNNAPPNSIVLPNKATDERGFAFATSLYTRTYNFEANAFTQGLYPAGSQLILVGRYPTNANECNVWQLESGALDVDLTGDPFDYIPNGSRDVANGRFIELDGFDNVPEFQRGFVWTGQHQIRRTRADGAELQCWGSEWDTERVLAQFNLANFVQDDVAGVAAWNQQKAFLPSQGVVLVEMYWMHDLLMNFPFMDSVVTFFGDPNNIVISAWAAFPVPAAEPNIIYGLP
jgi:hypothetical protein